MKLEILTLPVSDVDRAKAFYADILGFNCDHDTVISENMRVVQLTPPGRRAPLPSAWASATRHPGRLRA